MGKTLFAKLWDSHVVKDIGDGYVLLHVDRHVLNDIGGVALSEVDRRGFTVAAPALNFAVPDHTVPTLGQATAIMPVEVVNLRRDTRRHKVRLFDVGESGSGIIHVMAPEEALALPGYTFACGDSHTSTIGGLGALAWGVGLSEVVHILATQTSLQRKPQTLRISVDGVLPQGVSGKDVILRLIREFGGDAGVGYAVEFAGPVIKALDMDGRFTVCNMAAEMGARFGFIAPDEKTCAYLKGRMLAPTGAQWDAALAQWQTLVSDDDAVFDQELRLDVTAMKPQVTWGTGGDHVIDIDGIIPDPLQEPDVDRRGNAERALSYMGLRAGMTIRGVPIDWAFIGSCTNARLSDLREAAAVVRGRKVAPGVRAWVVPGSVRTKAEAEAEHLDRVFVEAGFEWRDPSCSMCLGMNGDIVKPGERSVSTTNRNYESRQGPGARTHLASPALVAASAIAGHITDLSCLD